MTGSLKAKMVCRIPTKTLGETPIGIAFPFFFLAKAPERKAGIA